MSEQPKAEVPNKEVPKEEHPKAPPQCGVTSAVQLGRAYTFAECGFDFSDVRTERQIRLFGALDIAQDVVECAMLGAGSSRHRHVYTNADEQIGLSSEQAFIPALHSDVAERIGISAACARRMERFTTISERIGLMDEIPAGLYTEVCERLGVSVVRARKYEAHMSVAEHVGMGCGVLRAPMRYIDLADGIAVSDDYVNILDRCIMLHEHIGIADSAVFVPPLRTDVIERVGVQKETVPPLRTDVIEGGSIAEGLHLIPAHRTHELRRIGILDTFDAEQSLHTVIMEGVGIAQEMIDPTIRTPIPVHLALRDAYAFIPARRTIAAVGVGLRETFAIIPAIRSVFREGVSLYDRMPQACGGALSDVAIGKDMTLEQFREFCTHPTGYEAFRPFRVGEYEYEKALVRIAMTAGSVGSIPQIYDVVMNVDIEDTVDRGTVRMTAKETVVPYHKKYYTQPEVVVTLQGGNAKDGVLIPSVLSIGKESFTCVLRKADGSPAAGIISWTSVGY
jgi:hypothetical protein